MDYNFSKLRDHEYEELSKDLLNKALNLKLDFNTHKKKDFDLVQLNNDKVEIVSEVYYGRLLSNSINQIISNVKMVVSLLKPKQYILVFFESIEFKRVQEINLLSSQFSGTEISMLDLDWIEAQLNQNPEIAEKYKLVDKKQKQNKAREVELKIDKDYFIEKYNNILQESDFLFDKAIEVLDQLTTYNIPPNVKDIKEIPKPSPIEKLREHWDKRIDIKPKDFPEYLEQKDPELVELYEMITKFITYVDTKGWNKQKLNEYDDKRAIARTGVRQNILIDHFFKYAANNFKIPDKDADKAFFRAIEYLNNPEVKFNILSERHRELISQYFLGKVFVGNNFHVMLLNFFKRFVFVAQNPKNLTFFFTRIIYDDKFRQHWADYDIAEEIDITDEEDFRKIVSTKFSKTILTNDEAYTEEDLLDIENDVRSFALILAAKDIHPPLAIALFGKWGSGKSFFMEHLAKRVHELSVHQGFLVKKEHENDVSDEIIEEPFCKGIAQIRFNAWSYLDANLWASLVTKIFEKLDEYITGENVIEKEKQKARKVITENLIIVKEEKIQITKEVDQLKTEKETLEGEIETLIEQKDDFHDKIVKQSIADIKKKAKDEIKDIEENVKTQLDNYGISRQRIDEISPNALFNEVSSWTTFLSNVGKFNTKHAAIAIAILFLLIVYSFMPLEILDNFKNKFYGQIPIFIGIAGPIFAKFYDSFSKFKKVLVPVIDYKNRFNETFESLKMDYEKQLSTLNTEVAQKEKKIKQKQIKLATIDEQIKNHKYQLKHSITKRAFVNFVSRKAKDEGYEKYIGIISIIRNDFETLSGLFKEITMPDQEVLNKMSQVEIEDLKKKKAKSDSFRSYYEKPLDRIVLYIDDLDRCSDDKVLEVIQAIHLLMAFPLFNVVVGVDKRCVRNALFYKSLNQYSKFAKPAEVKEAGIHVISPDEYLEKIFQIPFQLKNPSDKSVKGLIDSLLKGQIEISKPEIKENKEVVPEIKVNIPKSEVQAQSNKENENNLSKPTFEKKKEKEITSADLKLKPIELKLLKEIICLVGSTPRTIKRFINIYRIIRVHQDFRYDNNNQQEEFLAIMFILALNIGQYKKYSFKLMEQIETNKFESLNSLLEEDSQMDRIRVSLENNPVLEELLSFSGNSHFNSHIPLVSRFTFSYEKYDIEQENDKTTPTQI